MFIIVAVVATVLSLFASTYFKRAALDAQKSSLSRVIEVASQEIFKQVKNQTFNLGMKLAHNKELIVATNNLIKTGKSNQLTLLLDDPFIHGFVGFSEVDLKKLRVFNLDHKLISESNKGLADLDANLNQHIQTVIASRKQNERLKAIDALWKSREGHLFSMIVPIGGLRPIGYLEIIVNPVFNITRINNITKTPIHVYSMSGELLYKDPQEINDNYLPIEFILKASNGEATLKIVSYENIIQLNQKMEQTQLVTVSVFLLLLLLTLVFALWLINRFLFLPVNRMIFDMSKVTHGKLDITVNNKGLKEFHLLANAFNSMSEQVRMRTNELQQLLDLDDSALLCFDKDNETVYFNTGATNLFGYTQDESSDLDLSDLFVDDVALLMSHPSSPDNQSKHLRAQLNCKHKDGYIFQSDAVITVVAIMDSNGLAILLNKDLKIESIPLIKEQRLNAVEQTLSRLMSFSNNTPSLTNDHLTSHANDTASITQKILVREQAVTVMNLALDCWVHELGKSKIDLAEESNIWPVYMDKSTPTTRTLDKYLNITSCPKHPRIQRVVDTGEFVIRQAASDQCEKQNELQMALDALRQLLSGV